MTLQGVGQEALVSFDLHLFEVTGNGRRQESVGDSGERRRSGTSKDQWRPGQVQFVDGTDFKKRPKKSGPAFANNCPHQVVAAEDARDIARLTLEALKIHRSACCAIEARKCWDILRVEKTMIWEPGV